MPSLSFLSASYVAGAESYAFNSYKLPFTNESTKTDKVQVGTKNNRAGWGWSKIYMAAKVATIPAIYPIKEVVKKGNENYFNDFTFFLMQTSTSYFKQSATKRPGMTISPKPNILNF